MLIALKEYFQSDLKGKTPGGKLGRMEYIGYLIINYHYYEKYHHSLKPPDCTNCQLSQRNGTKIVQK